MWLRERYCSIEMRLQVGYIEYKVSTKSKITDLI